MAKGDTTDESIADRLIAGKVLPRCVFTHKGMTVHEYLVPWDGGRSKVIWVRDGHVDKMVVGGKYYPLFQHDVEPGTSEQAAIEAVRAMFEAYYAEDVAVWQSVEDAAKRGAAGLNPKPM